MKSDPQPGDGTDLSDDDLDKIEQETAEKAATVKPPTSTPTPEPDPTPAPEPTPEPAPKKDDPDPTPEPEVKPPPAPEPERKPDPAPQPEPKKEEPPAPKAVADIIKDYLAANKDDKYEDDGEEISLEEFANRYPAIVRGWAVNDYRAQQRFNRELEEREKKMREEFEGKFKGVLSEHEQLQQQRAEQQFFAEVQEKAGIKEAAARKIVESPKAVEAMQKFFEGQPRWKAVAWDDRDPAVMKEVLEHCAKAAGVTIESAMPEPKKETRKPVQPDIDAHRGSLRGGANGDVRREVDPNAEPSEEELDEIERKTLAKSGRR